MTVEHMLKTMSASELMEWRAFIQVERGQPHTQRVRTPEEIDAEITAVFGPLTADPGGAKWQSRA